MKDGDVLGFAVGVLEGCLVGTSEILDGEVGENEDTADTDTIGKLVGALDGLQDGPVGRNEVGALDGIIVGLVVGLMVGSTVGFIVGLMVQL